MHPPCPIPLYIPVRLEGLTCGLFQSGQRRWCHLRFEKMVPFTVRKAPFKLKEKHRQNDWIHGTLPLGSMCSSCTRVMCNETPDCQSLHCLRGRVAAQLLVTAGIYLVRGTTEDSWSLCRSCFCKSSSSTFHQK